MAFDPSGTFQQRIISLRSPVSQHLSVCLLVFVLAAAAGVGVYLHQHPHPSATTAAPVSPSVLGARYHSLLNGEIAALGPFQTAGPGMIYISSSNSDAPDIRASSGAALALAVQAFGELPHARQITPTSGAGRVPPMPSTAARAIWIMRYLARTHRSGSGSLPDGSKWGGSDASAVDAANLGLAAFLLRPWLDAQVRTTVADVVRFEAERYLLSSPASGVSGDSAAISNAAASNVLCVASSLYASGQARTAYQRRAEHYLSLILISSHDIPTNTNPSVEPNLFPDMTLQFKGNFSASAELEVIGTLARCALAYRLRGEEAPPQVRKNVTDCWRRVLVKLAVADGWFLGGEGRVTPGGTAVSWIAAAFNDAAAQAVDRDAIERITHAPWLHGNQATTSLAQTRPCEVAISSLLYGYFAQSNGPVLPLTDVTLAHSLSGVTWMPTASLAVNRNERLSTSYSWTSGAGQEWLLDSAQHVQWRFSPGPAGSMSPGVISEGPAWTVGRDSFATAGVLRLENGAAVQAAVYSLPGGGVILLEHTASAGDLASITLFKNTSSQEPDLFRDDEHGKKIGDGGFRWANMDDNLGIVLVKGAVTSMAEPGVLDNGARREVWPIMAAGPAADGTIVIALYPNVSARETRLLAAEAHPLAFASAGWSGLIVPGEHGSDELVISRFNGATSNTVTLSSDDGAPVTVEEASVSGAISSLAISSPAGAALLEPITCWLNVGSRSAIAARQGAEENTASITNPSQDNVEVTAHYLSSGRPCTVTEEDGHIMVRLSSHDGMGEVHFYLGPGRSVMLKY